jgi:hypothetical protein
MKKNLIQAYKQAPWRTQLQWIGIFLLVLVLVAAIAGVYLNVSARSAAAGRQIQTMENQISELQLEINDLATKLAMISSSQHMSARLEESEFSLLNPNEALYIEVPGYQPETSLVLAPPADVNTISSSILKPEYSNSLWDRLLEAIRNSPKNSSGSSEVYP